MTASHTGRYWFSFWPGLAILSALLVSVAPYPFVFVLLIWLSGLIYAAKASHSTRRAICINLAAIVGLFLVLEAHWVNKKALREQPNLQTERTDGFSEKDPILGMKPSANYSGLATKSANGQVSYAVTYTTDPWGRRVMPEPSGADNEQCLLFLGCSFTFGDGVEDSETMPYQVSQLLNRKGYNLGVSGYGPHHMLAAIEFELLPDELDSCGSKVAIYQAIPDHVKRSAGLGQYGTFGPKYILANGNAAEYAGQFGDANEAGKNDSIWAKLFSKSYIYQEYAIDRDWIGDHEIELYLSIVKEARERLKKQYPDMKFIILYWDTSPRTYSKILDERLPELADEYMRVTDIVPDINNNKPQWYLNYDAHPNARAHNKVAEYVATKLAE